MARLSFFKARKLKKLGYFKLPKTGHPWVGSPYKWARITEDRRVMPYTESYLAQRTIPQLTEEWLYLNASKPGSVLMHNNKKLVK